MKRVERWTSWVVIGREPDGSEWLAATGHCTRTTALIEAQELAGDMPSCKLITRPVSNEVALALPRKEPSRAR